MTTLIEHTSDDGIETLRHIRAADLAFLYECLEDWVADENGPYTLRRAETTLSVWLRQTADFRQVGEGLEALVYSIDGEPVGVYAGTKVGRAVSVDLIALHPSRRGQGLSTRMIRLMRVRGFDQHEATDVHFETRPDPAAIDKEIRRATAEEVGHRPVASGRKLRVFRYDAAAREAAMDDEEAALHAAVENERASRTPGSEISDSEAAPPTRS